MTAPRLAQPPAAAVPPGTAAGARWRLRLLGGFELDDGRHRLQHLRSRAATALLARLAMQPGRDHGREELVALLWPDAPAAAGRARLRQTLSLLRAVLEPPGGTPVLAADRRVIALVPGALWCDAAAFERAVAQGERAQAIALYRGELLPGHYDEWILEERRRLDLRHESIAGDAGAAAVPASPVTAATAPAMPAMPAAGPDAGSRLPHYLTRLIGADLQGARLRQLVAAQRLVTVLGPGGAGKTRLAVEVARWLAQPGLDGEPAAFDRAVFVSLIGAVDAAQCMDRLLLALRLEAGGEAAELVTTALEGQRVLLVLDNAEQLDAAAAMALAGLAEQLPQAHWLITSRRPLELDGEHGFMIAPLDPPSPDASPAELAMNPGVALFVERARAHRADFHLHAGNAQALAALVRHLQGLPLAIELAASRSRTAGPAEILAWLQAAARQPTPTAAGLNYLARRGARGGHDPRHASMWAVVDWSWQLLDGVSRQALSALCLLPAGTTAAGAAALWAAAGQAADTLDAQARLDTLVAHAVVRTEPGQDGQWRYLPYEPVREYVLALHDEADLRAGRSRVLAMLLDWAHAMPATPPLPSVRDELPNVMQALATAPADGDADRAVLLVLVLQGAWGEIALPAGALASLDALLEAPGVDDSRAAAAHALAATFHQVVGQADASRRHMAAALARPCPDDSLRANMLSRLARMRWRVDKDAAGARALIEQALPLARACGRSNTEAALLSLLSHLALVVDRDHDTARRLGEQCRALWNQSGNRHLINAGRYNAAVQAAHAGRAAQMLDEFIALEAEGRALQDWDLASGALEARGTALLRLRRWDESAACQFESMAVAWAGMERLSTVYALWNLPPALVRQRRAELAALAMGCAEAQWRQRFGAFDASDRRDLTRVRRGCRVLLGAAATQAAWQRGAALSLGEAVRMVLAARNG